MTGIAVHQNVSPPLPPLLGSEMQADPTLLIAEPGCDGALRVRPNQDAKGRIPRDLALSPSRPPSLLVHPAAIGLPPT